jgi:hypothetical protein
VVEKPRLRLPSDDDEQGPNRVRFTGGSNPTGFADVLAVEVVRMYPSDDAWMQPVASGRAHSPAGSRSSGDQVPLTKHPQDRPCVFGKIFVRLRRTHPRDAIQDRSRIEGAKGRTHFPDVWVVIIEPP